MQDMAAGLVERIADLVQAPPALSEQDRADVLTAFADTLACIHAGWHEPVSRRVASAWRGGSHQLLDGTTAPTAEHAALITATAGHALDYDDVNLESTTHPSVVIIPALLAMQAAGGYDQARLGPAFAVGLAVNVAIGRTLGFAHYRRGWHATSTIGPLAGAAALAHLMGFDATTTRHALAMAAAQSGGLQRNFGAMAKPAQAGFGAAAAVRAAMLAQVGLTAAEDIFAPGGFFDLYGGDAGATERGAVAALDARPGGIARKLFPCCYATHRLIAAALAARAAFGGAVPAEAEVTLLVPAGGMQPLRSTLPGTGLEAKFSAEYTVAVALWRGAVSLSDFEDEAVEAPEAAQRMARVRVIEEAPGNDGIVDLEHGSARLSVALGGAVVARGEAGASPGSPARPATEAEMAAKIADCLARYSASGGRTLSPEDFMDSLRRQLEPGAPGASAVRLTLSPPANSPPERRRVTPGARRG